MAIAVCFHRKRDDDGAIRRGALHRRLHEAGDPNPRGGIHHSWFGDDVTSWSTTSGSLPSCPSTGWSRRRLTPSSERDRPLCLCGGGRRPANVRRGPSAVFNVDAVPDEGGAA
jgi:hypothetical protein